MDLSCADDDEIYGCYCEGLFVNLSEMQPSDEYLAERCCNFKKDLVQCLHAPFTVTGKDIPGFRIMAVSQFETVDEDLRLPTCVSLIGDMRKPPNIVSNRVRWFLLAALIT